LNFKVNTGHEALKSMSVATDFNKWMYNAIKDYTQGEILEIGSGIGNISKLFIDNGSAITLSDIDDDYIQFLKKEFPLYLSDKEILSIDLEKEGFETKYSHLAGKYDSLILINVLEHLKDDSAAIQNCRFLLKKNGILIILVPAYSFLFSEIDKSLGHYRRYNRKQLVEIMKNEKFKIVRSFYFNAIGIFAWLYGKIMKYKFPPESNMKTFNKMIRVGKFLDKLVFQKTGLSAIAVAKKI
jgi:2-polyprenyl-3-methyl-5-hydroxy-6-metoxy-1,4-benzoquinol methylase